MPRPKKRTLVNPNETAKLKKQIIDKVLSSKKNGVGSANLGSLVDGWLELESDPGTFSLLIEDLGCFGAQVDEIYDLEQKFERPVYGFIFLFKWLNNHQQSHQSDRSLRQQIKLATNQATTPNQGQSTAAAGTQSDNETADATTSTNRQSSTEQLQHNNDHHHNNHHRASLDANSQNDIFFAKQMISNSCATHALISVLLNCDHDEVDLGPTLTHLREYTKVMAPEDKGYAIGNLPLIAKAHNSHASYSSLYCRDRPNQQRGLSFAIRGNQRTNLQQTQPETYHFVSYVPIRNRLYELDGLRNNPIDHGPIEPNEDWTEKFRRVIKQRLLENKSEGNADAMNEIRFNLMAVVPDKRLQIKSQVTKLKRHLETMTTAIKECEKNLARNSSSMISKTKSTICNDDNAKLYLNPASSPTSYGTLTASETGSVCAGSPRHSQEGELGDTEIPNPPYSPLSNDTLTASESGSVCNSPSRYEDSFLLDDKDHADKYFIIKLEPTPKPVVAKDEVHHKSAPLDHMRDQWLKAIADMKKITRQIKRDIDKNVSLLEEENDKRRKYKLDNSRRTHNYEPFIMTFLSMLAKQGNLADLIERDLGIIRTEVPEPQTVAPPQKPQPTSKAASKQHLQQSAKPFKVPTTAPPLQQQRATNQVHRGRKAQSREQPKQPSQGAPTKLVQRQQTASQPAPPPQAPAQETQEEEPEEERPRVSLSGRPIRSTKSKYISTGKPRGRPKKSP